jgi:hypothetical protein
MLNPSAATNNRAGSFIGHSLSPAGDFPKEILHLPAFEKLNAQAEIAYF